jgi:hypothetical protein
VIAYFDPVRGATRAGTKVLKLIVPDDPDYPRWISSGNTVSIMDAPPST